VCVCVCVCVCIIHQFLQFIGTHWLGGASQREYECDQVLFRAPAQPTRDYNKLPGDPSWILKCQDACTNYLHNSPILANLPAECFDENFFLKQ